jgi:hypothetical protein
MPEPMLLVDFPGGGHLSVEFRDDAPGGEEPRLGARLELRVAEPAAVPGRVLRAGTAGRAPRPRALLHGPRRQVLVIARDG